MGNTSIATEATAASSFNGYLGLALTIIFVVLFIAFLAEICYLACRKNKLITITNPPHHTYSHDTEDQLTGATLMSSCNSASNLYKASAISINSPAANHQFITLQQHLSSSSSSPTHTITELAEINSNSVQVINSDPAAASTGIGSTEYLSSGQANVHSSSNRNPNFYVLQLSPIMEETRDDISHTTASCTTTPSPSPALNQTVNHLNHTNNNRSIQVPALHNNNHNYYYVSSPSPNLQNSSPLLSPYAARAVRTPSPGRNIINYVSSYNSLSLPASPPSDHLSPVLPSKQLSQSAKASHGVSLGFLFQMSPYLHRRNSDLSRSSSCTTDDHITTHSPLIDPAHDHSCNYSRSHVFGKTQNKLQSVKDMINHDDPEHFSCTVSSPSPRLSELPGCLRSTTAPPRQGRHRHSWIFSFILNR